MISKNTLNMKRLVPSCLLLVLVFGAAVFWQTAGSVEAALPPPTTLSMATSSRDAYAKYQTITYSASVTQAGTLTHVIMTLPAGATAGTMRSSSGTVENYRTGQIIWRPAAPIKVAVGAKLGIPVVGINYMQAGTTNMWVVASDSAGNTLAYARGDFTLSNLSTSCQPTGNDYIRAENQKAGTPKTEWKIDPAAFAPSTFAGFANAESYKCGDIAYFKVDSQLTSYATATVYRMGYYGGTGAREVWRTTNYFLTGKQAPVRIINTTSPAVKNMADASHWNYNIGIRVDGRFTPGTYLVKLSDRGGRETYVPFTVRDDSGVKHAFMYQQATTTWQAYNGYGGHSFYTAIPKNASRLSFNRPYSNIDGLGSGEFLQLESGMVYQMEKEGKDVAYWTDTDLHTRGVTNLAARADTLILPAHDEYYSVPMRTALDAAINQYGVNLVSFGSNQIHREIVYTSGNRAYDVRNAYGMTSGADYYKTTFRRLGGNQHEQAILGAQYGCAGHGDVTTNDAWLWRGIPVGTKLNGFINGEADYQNSTERAYRLGTVVPVPAGNQKLVAGLPMHNCRISGEAAIADIVTRVTPSGARVFGGSTFSYGCFTNKSCPPRWSMGPKIGTDASGRPVFERLVISDSDSRAAATVVNNVLYWAETGQVPPEL